MKTLLKQIKKFQDDIDYDVFEKLKGIPYPQGSVEIFWNNREETDKGYIFVLPMQDINDHDFCVHIPFPDNSEGIGDAEEVHMHIYNILSNELVEKVIVEGGIYN